MKGMNDLKDRLGRRHLVCRLAVMLLIMLGIILPEGLQGQFAGGSGIESDPYQVATAEHLDQVRNYLDAHFIQTADIDLGVTPWNEGEGWLPIGDNSNGFTGKYDGNYKVITGLTINRPESSISVALFSYLKTGGQILNLGVTNVQIIGKGTVGSLVGFAFNGTVSNCYSSGTLLGESKVGGLVAHNGGSSGLIANSFSTADISATSYFADMGGLVGQNNTARIEDSYSHGNVYHSGETISTTSYGAFLGSNVYSGTVVRSYSTGQVKQDDVIATDKGFCGRYETGYMANNFWDTETSGASATAGTASGKTSTEMKTQSTYTDAGWDFATKWAIYPGMYEGYPFHLWYDTPPFVADFSASPLTGLAPLTVQFTDLSSGNPTSWSWNFDTDGTEDDASQNPQFTYNNPGTYTVTLNISGSSATDTLIRTAYITVIDAGNAIVSTPTGGNWTDASTWIDGVVPATDDDVIIQGPVIVNASRTCNNLTVLDTGMLENGSNYITLTVKGIINNQGVIRRASSYWLSVKAFKNIYNSGEMSFRELQLAGEVDQTLYQNGNGLFSMNMMSLLDTSNNVYSGSELTFSKTDISLNRGRFILNHPLNLTGGAKLRYVYLKGQNNELSFTKNAGLDQYAVISHAVLTDTVKILGSSVSLADGVVNAGVIENSQSFLTLDVIGDLQNEGVIRSVSPYWLMVKAFRDIYNSGDVSIYELQLAGEVDQTLYQNGNGLFSMNMMSLLDTSNNIYSGSELTFSKTNISLSRGRFILNHKLNLTDGAKLRYVNLNGQDNEISFTKNAGLDQYSVISNAVLTDTVIILYHSVSLADGVVNAGVIENGGSYYTLNVIGDVQNEGIVRNASPYSLTISLKGSLLNSGIWTPYRTNVEGTETQIIGMVDGINLGGDFYFYSDVTGSSYQWKKDAQNISGATSSSYKLTGLTPSEYGLYVCDVAGQMSRSIEVRRYGVVADFVADPLKIQPSMAVNFMDLSVGNPTWWNWTFGDGQSSTEQNPVHVYDDEGLFTVTLIAGDETYRDTLIREEYISVFFINEPPLSFSLIYPEDHGQIHTRRPTFYWRTAHDVDQGRKYVTGYRHYLADNEEMSDPLVSWCEEPKLALETDLNEDVQYWWKVEAVDDGDTSTFSETRTFFVNASNSVPEPFALISPLGDEETGGLPALLWHRSWDKDPGDVISYSVCLGRSIQDMTEIYTGSDTSFALTESLNENTRYFWRVNAVDLSGGQRRNMNEAGSFIVNSENDAPLPFELITPTPLSVEVTLTPLFYWEKSMDPDILDEVHYKLYLSPDSLFTDHTPVVLDTNTLVSHELADNGTYFWKVEALDDHGAVTGSPTHKFWTNTVMEPPLPFALLFPDNQATNIPLTPEFIWKKAVDPDPNDDAQYEILVASDSLFEDVVLNAFTARDTSYTPETELDNNRVYFWKIIATGMDSLSAESPVFSFVTTTLSIWDKLPIPEEFTLYQNYPNPFNPTTTIAYGVPESGVVRLDIYDITGRHIIQLVNGEKTPGWHTINWNCTNAYGQQLSSGVYIYRLTAPDIHLVKKMMVMK